MFNNKEIHISRMEKAQPLNSTALAKFALGYSFL